MLQGVPYHLKLCVNRGSDCFLQGEIAVGWFVNHQSINLDKWYLGASEKKLTRMLHFIDIYIHMYITWCWWMIPFICFVIICTIPFCIYNKLSNFGWNLKHCFCLQHMYMCIWISYICTDNHLCYNICYLPVIVIILKSFKYLEKLGYL